MPTYFTSDTHFGHANIIKYCNRPFANVDKMDNALINNWNSVVQQNDTIYHLGDFSLGFKPAQDYLKRLNGNIIFCWGNHDKALSNHLRDKSQKPIAIADLRDISVDGQRMTLCHYAMRVWNKSHHNAWHLYGHSHGTLPDDSNSLSLDVGVDCWNYTPVSMHQLRERMNKKTYKPIDHHGS